VATLGAVREPGTAVKSSKGMFGSGHEQVNIYGSIVVDVVGCSLFGRGIWFGGHVSFSAQFWRAVVKVAQD
jgi:hypothetical protein